MNADQAKMPKTTPSAVKDDALMPDNMRRAAYALNLCMVSLSQIVDYNNLDVLRNEYDAILNNLNIEKVIKDDALLAAFEKMLDVCHFFILHAKDKEILKKKQELRLKGALSKALGGGNVIAILGSPNPWAIAAGAAAMIGVAAVNYKSQRAQARLENEIEEWELEKSALEQLHNLRRQLFETAWKLEERFKYPDEYRLTEKQITIYNDIIKDPDPQNRYERLYLIRDYFEAYPLFWYYLGRSALETSELYRVVGSGERLRAFDAGDIGSDSQIYSYYLRKAKEAYDKFRETHAGNELMREDLISASAYLDHAQLCGEEEVDDILDDIRHAKKLAGTDVEVMQNCAFRFLQLLDLYSNKKEAGKAKECKDEAIYCLKFLLNRDSNPELNGMILSKIFIDGGDAESLMEYRILKACIGRKCSFVYHRMKPWNEKLFENDWSMYVNGTGILRTAYNFFYGYVWLENADFFCALDSAKASHSYEFMRDVKDAFENEKQIMEEQQNNKEEQQNNENVRTLFNIMYAEKDSAPPFVGEIVKSSAVACNKAEDGKCNKTMDGKIKRGEKLDKAMGDFFDEAFERDWRKLWFGTRAVDFNDDVFSKREKALLASLDIRVKELAQQYVDEFKGQYGRCECDYMKIVGDDGESEAIKAILFMEREVERLRLQIQGRLSSGKRFWYPDPQYKESKMLLELYKTDAAIYESESEKIKSVQLAASCNNEIRKDVKALPSDLADSLAKNGIHI